MLSLLHHPNLVNLIGYCADGDQRLLVYEFMSLGSLEDHLHGIFIKNLHIISFQFFMYSLLADIGNKCKCLIHRYFSWQETT